MNGALPIFLVYGVWLLGVVILVLLGWLVYDKRYNPKQAKPGFDPTKPSNGFIQTAEVFIDPKNGYTYRVYYNPRTGDREYVRER